MVKKKGIALILGIVLAVGGVFCIASDFGGSPSNNSDDYAFAAANSSKKVSRSKAKRIALNHAQKKYGVKKSKVYDFDIERDYYRGRVVWEVDFETYQKGGEYSYEYKIRRSNGKIMHFEREWDD